MAKDTATSERCDTLLTIQLPDPVKRKIPPPAAPPTARSFIADGSDAQTFPAWALPCYYVPDVLVQIPPGVLVPKKAAGARIARTEAWRWVAVRKHELEAERQALCASTTRDERGVRVRDRKRNYRLWVIADELALLDTFRFRLLEWSRNYEPAQRCPTCGVVLWRVWPNHSKQYWSYCVDAQLWHPPGRDGHVSEEFAHGLHIKNQPWCPTADEVAEAERTVPRLA